MSVATAELPVIKPWAVIPAPVLTFRVTAETAVLDVSQLKGALPSTIRSGDDRSPVVVACPLEGQIQVAFDEPVTEANPVWLTVTG